jgi:hypothetical protein
MTALTDLVSALDSARTTMTLSSQDWATAGDFAWLYGILVGWDDDPEGGDVDQGDALGELAAKFGWTTDDVERLRRLHTAVAGFDVNLAADLEAAR